MWKSIGITDLHLSIQRNNRKKTILNITLLIEDKYKIYAYYLIIIIE